MLIDTLRKEARNALLAKDELKKSILRVVIGEIDTIVTRENKELTDERVVSIIRKVITSNEETIKAGGDKEKLTLENSILFSFLPKTLSLDEIEAFFLNGDGPHFERIQDAKTEGQAIGIAMKEIKAAGLPVLSSDVVTVIKAIRAAELLDLPHLNDV